MKTENVSRNMGVECRQIQGEWNKKQKNGKQKGKRGVFELSVILVNKSHKSAGFETFYEGQCTKKIRHFTFSSERQQIKD